MTYRDTLFKAPERKGLSRPSYKDPTLPATSRALVLVLARLVAIIVTHSLLDNLTGMIILPSQQLCW